MVDLYGNRPAYQLDRKDQKSLVCSLFQNARHAAQWTVFYRHCPSSFYKLARLNAPSRCEDTPDIGDLLLRDNVYSISPSYDREHTRKAPQRTHSYCVALAEYVPWKQRYFYRMRISRSIYSPERKICIDSTLTHA